MIRHILRAALAALCLSCAGSAALTQGVPNGGGYGVPNTPPGVQVNLNASVGPTVNDDLSKGYQVGSVWQNSSTGQIWIARSVSAGAAVWTNLELSDHPGYIAGWWYIPVGPNFLNSGSLPGAGSIRLYPGYIKQRITLSNLGVRVTTVSAGGNVQAAIYANNPTTMRPTGNPLVSTASMSTTAAASVSATAAVQLEPGYYWFASNCDNGTAIFSAVGNAGTFASATLGSATQANNIGGGNGGEVGLSVVQTFGTWPSLTAASFTELAGVGSIPLVQFQVSSIP